MYTTIRFRTTLENKTSTRRLRQLQFLILTRISLFQPTIRPVDIKDSRHAPDLMLPALCAIRGALGDNVDIIVSFLLIYLLRRPLKSDLFPKKRTIKELGTMFTRKGCLLHGWSSNTKRSYYHTVAWSAPCDMSSQR